MKLAILDLYDGTPNQGMRCIKEIANYYDNVIEWKVFDARGKAELPKVEDFDIFIGTNNIEAFIVPKSSYGNSGFLGLKAYF